MGQVAADPDRKGPLSGMRLGRYRLGGRLGSGGTASVYLALSEGPHNFGRVVALKVIHEHLLGERAFVDMFLDEANLAVRLNHPNIVHVYDLLHEEGRLVMAMEYLEGQPLSRLVARVRQREMMLPYELSAWIAARALDGLEHAHHLTDELGVSAKVVHRDVSPQNIFITYAGHTKIIDFGIARAEGRLQQTDLGQVKGKFAYLAPEQALSRDYDHRADIFSLGITLYEAAVGARLFPELDRVEALHKIVMGEIPDPKLRVPGFPEGLRKIILRAIEGDPVRRYQSAKEMAEALDAFVAEQGGAPAAERLASLMQEQFEAEREQQTAWIVALKQGQPGEFKEHTDSSFGLASDTGIVKKRANYWGVGLALAVLLAGITAGLARFSGPFDSDSDAGQVGANGAKLAVSPPGEPGASSPVNSARGDEPREEPTQRDRARGEAAGSGPQAEKARLPKRSPLIKTYPF